MKVLAMSIGNIIGAMGYHLPSFFRINLHNISLTLVMYPITALNIGLSLNFDYIVKKRKNDLLYLIL